MENIENPIDPQVNNPVETTPDQIVTPKLNTEPIKTKKKIVLIILIIIAFLLIIIGMTYSIKNGITKISSSPQSNNDAESVVQSTSTVTDVDRVNPLQLVKLSLQESKEKFGLSDEITGDEYSLYFYPTGNLSLIKQFKLDLISKVNNVFVDNGFNKDTSGSVFYPNDTDLFGGDSIYVYENSNMECNFYMSTELQIPNIIRIYCMQVINLNNQIDEEDFNAISKEIKKNGGVRKLMVTKYNEKYARVSVYFYGDGNNEILTKVDGSWKVIASEGQDSPLCENLDKYEVPIDFYKRCWLDNSASDFRKGSFQD